MLKCDIKKTFVCGVEVIANRFLGERDQTLEVLATDKLVRSIFSKSVNPEVVVLFVEKEVCTDSLSVSYFCS